jgi:hypothetical protein
MPPYSDPSRSFRPSSIFLLTRQELNMPKPLSEEDKSLLQDTVKVIHHALMAEDIHYAQQVLNQAAIQLQQEQQPATYPEHEIHGWRIEDYGSHLGVQNITHPSTGFYLATNIITIYYKLIEERKEERIPKNIFDIRRHSLIQALHLLVRTFNLSII